MTTLRKTVGLGLVLIAAAGVIVLRSSPQQSPPLFAAPAPTVMTTATPVAPVITAATPKPAPQQVDEAREAYKLSLIAKDCKYVMWMYEKEGQQDPKLWDQCKRYLTEPLPDWKLLEVKALEGRDLLARVQIESVDYLTMGNKESYEQLVETIKEVRASNDAEAQLALAFMMMNPEIGGPDITAAMAMMIKACSVDGCPIEATPHGRDCLANGQCASGTSMLDYYGDVVGPGIMQAAAELNK